MFKSYVVSIYLMYECLFPFTIRNHVRRFSKKPLLKLQCKANTTPALYIWPSRQIEWVVPLMFSLDTWGFSLHQRRQAAFIKSVSTILGEQINENILHYS